MNTETFQTIDQFLAENRADETAHAVGVIEAYLAEEADLTRERQAAAALASQCRAEIRHSVMASGYPIFAGVGLAFGWTNDGDRHD